ncbi:MAG: DUF4365 domain-containing protein [Thioalkalivibrio sp.]|nr:DUF4365 domain-containing protein [Thioalkalivibrio sp.]
MDRLQWSRLNHLQVGRYAEYYFKMEFTLAGMSVFGAEVDDRGIDMVLRTDDGRHFDVQVKSARQNTTYIFFRKDLFELRQNMLAAIALFRDGAEPRLFLIPSLDWRNPNELLCDKDYEAEELVSKPEWGIRLSKKNLPLLEPYALGTVLPKIAKSSA